MWHSQNPSTDERNENVGEDLDGIFGSIVVMHSPQTGIYIPKPQVLNSYGKAKVLDMLFVRDQLTLTPPE